VGIARILGFALLNSFASVNYVQWGSHLASALRTISKLRTCLNLHPLVCIHTFGACVRAYAHAAILTVRGVSDVG